MNNSAYTTREFTYPALTKIALLVVLPVMLIAVSAFIRRKYYSGNKVLAGTF